MTKVSIEVDKSTYLKNISAYCDVCNNNIVSSDKKSSGSFFSKGGYMRKEYGLGYEYVRVYFAICSDCLKSTSKKE